MTYDVKEIPREIEIEIEIDMISLTVLNPTSSITSYYGLALKPGNRKRYSPVHPKLRKPAA